MKPSINEPAIYHEQTLIYLPYTGAALPPGGFFGTQWLSDGVSVVSHPDPGTTFETQFRRSRFTSAASNNNELGVHLLNTDMRCAWLGNAAKRGGFYFSCRFLVNAIPDTAVRLFVGISGATGIGVSQSATIPGNTIGLWLGSGDAGSLTILTANAAGGAAGGANAGLTPLRNSSGSLATLTLTAGFLYEFVMLCNPNQNLVVTNIIDVAAGTLLRTQNVNTTMPDTTAFMAPQVSLSNALHAAGNDCKFDLYGLYLRPNLRETPA